MRRGLNCRPFAPAGVVGRRLDRLAPFVLLLLLAGCVPEPAFDNDPLLGGRALPRGGGLGTPSGAVAVAPRTPVAPFSPAASLGAASPAALAAGALPDSSTLRIGPQPTNPTPSGGLTAAPHDAGDAWHGTATSAGATLKQPLLVTDPAVRPIAVIAPSPSGNFPPPVAPPVAPAASSQYEALQDQLMRRGVQFQSLEGPDEHGMWRFSCGVPSKDPQGGVHRIELTALGDRGLAAVRAAIDQIDQYQR